MFMSHWIKFTDKSTVCLKEALKYPQTKIGDWIQSTLSLHTIQLEICRDTKERL